ncbi:MAG TPA: hypothetical protein VG738_04860 [Chitinophagaceae bacterium]|nr:hypothetical protein [Chitinophagaceae bacterium]
MNKPLLLLTAFLFCILFTRAQTVNKDSAAANSAATNFSKQRDAIDIIYWFFGKDPSKRIVDTTHPQVGKLYFSGSPAVAYSLQTGFSVLAEGNFAFYLGPDTTTKISSVLAEIEYTQKHQFLLPFRINIWSKENKYNFIGDWRFLKYPQDTYGIGGSTKLSDAYTVDYDYVRLYQFALRKIKNELYGGIGVQYDYHSNIKELNPPANSDFEKYGFSKSSTSSGLSLNLLYNTRKNLTNPEAGSVYMNVILRQNVSWLGSNSNWTSAIIDLRKYIHAGGRNNILAFWTYEWLTLSGNPPYLDLPSNGWDTYGNTARGYVQNRYRGKQMLYAEGEYRFVITHNQLFGGVVFANASSFTNLNNRFNGILPAAGAGLRVKFNKFSRTNVAVDYAIGKGGSHGLFLNLGEVF